MVCTTALSHGLDRPGIRLVLIIGFPFGLGPYIQQGGRAGRDGNPATVSLLSYPGWSNPDAEDLQGREQLEQLINNRHCRRLSISKFSDRVTITCGSLPGSQLCDVCEEEVAQHRPCQLPVPPMQTSPLLSYVALAVNAREAKETQYISQLYSVATQLSKSSCKFCAILYSSFPPASHTGDQCPTRLAENVPLVLEAIGTSLPRDLSLCFHCFLPQASGEGDAMNLHHEHVSGAPGSLCDLVGILPSVISAGLQSPRVLEVFKLVYPRLSHPTDILKSLKFVAEGLPNPINHPRPQIRVFHHFFLTTFAVANLSPQGQNPSSLQSLLLELTTHNTLPPSVFQKPICPDVFNTFVTCIHSPSLPAPVASLSGRPIHQLGQSRSLFGPMEGKSNGTVTAETYIRNYHLEGVASLPTIPHNPPFRPYTHLQHVGPRSNYIRNYDPPPSSVPLPTPGCKSKRSSDDVKRVKKKRKG